MEPTSSAEAGSTLNVELPVQSLQELPHLACQMALHANMAEHPHHRKSLPRIQHDYKWLLFPLFYLNDLSPVIFSSSDTSCTSWGREAIFCRTVASPEAAFSRSCNALISSSVYKGQRQIYNPLRYNGAKEN